MANDRLDELEDFPQVPSATPAFVEQPDGELEDFPSPEEAPEPPVGPVGATRRTRARRGKQSRRPRPKRRTVVIVAAVALVAVLAAVWLAMGRPGLSEPGPTQGPDFVPADPSMSASQVPFDQVEGPAPAPDAKAGDLLNTEPSELPAGLTAVRQDNGLWLVVPDAPEQDQGKTVEQSVLDAVAAADTGGEFSGEKMSAMMQELERQDNVLREATGRQLIVTFPLNGSISAWAPVRGDDGVVTMVYTAVGADAAAAEAAVRELAAGNGHDLGDRTVVNGGGQ